MAFNTTGRQKGQQRVRLRLRTKTGVLLPCLVNNKIQSLPSRSAVCLRINTTMWSHRINKEMTEHFFFSRSELDYCYNNPKLELLLANVNRLQVSASSIYHHTSLQRNPNSRVADVWVFLHHQPWTHRCVRSECLVACNMT